VPDLVSVENPSAVFDQKSHIGNWEADTFIGKNQKSASPKKHLAYETPSILFLNLFQPLVPECCI
jgi:transposase, IS30 family